MPKSHQDNSALLSLLRSKPKLQINTHYPYDMRTLALSLSNQSIDTIKLEFAFHNNRVNLQKFIWLLKQATRSDAENSYLVYYELVKLFEQIDIDKSNTIEWTELLEYLSETAWLADPSKDYQNTPDRKVLFEAFRQQLKYRKHPIKKIVEMQRLGLLGILTTHNQLTFINYYKNQTDVDNQEQQEELQQGKDFSLNSIDMDRVLSVDYSEQQRLFGVLLVNRNLCFVEESEIQKNRGVIRSSGTEIDIKYLPLHRLWCLESVSSTLQLFPSPKTASIQRKIIFKPHQQPLTGITEISNPLALCTSSLDGLIRLWQTASSKLIIELNVAKEVGWGQQRKGIKGMATYNKSFTSCIACWMFTSQIYLWLPSLSLSKPFAGQLRGHMGLVVQGQFSWCGELVSVDDKRAVRVWNTDRFECMQSFVSEEESPSLFVLRSKPYLIFYSKLLHFYRMRTNSKIDLQTDNSAPGTGHTGLSPVEGGSKLIGLEFSQYYAFLILTTINQIRIIDVNRPCVVAVIPSPTDDQFTHMAMKDSRRFYVSSSRGVVYEYRTEDGRLIRSIPVLSQNDEEDSDVKFVYYHEQTHILMVVIERLGYSEIVTYDQMQDSRKTKQIDFEQTDLRQFKFCNATNLFFILSQKCIITIWDYDRLVILNQIYLGHHSGLSLRNMTIDSDTATLILQGEEKIVLLQYDNNAAIHKFNLLRFNWDSHQSRTLIVGITVLRQKIRSKVFEEDQYSQTKGNQVQQQGKKVSFAITDIQAFDKSQNCINTAILAIATSFSQVYYYNLNQVLPQPFKRSKVVIRGKVQRMKEKRSAHIKTLPLPNPIEINYTDNLYNEQSTIAANVNTTGIVMGHFYFHSQDNTLLIADALGKIKAEWNVSLSKPKMWNLAYNQIEQVLIRLQKTEQAIQRIYKTNNGNFKRQFLIAKYLTAEEILELQKQEEKRKVEQAYVSSKRSISSKKTILGSQTKLKAVEENAPAIVPNQKPKNQQQNIFEKKVQQRNKRNLLQNNQQLYERVQKTLSYCKQISKSVPKIGITHSTAPTHDKITGFASQIEHLFVASTVGNTNALNLGNSEAKSRKQEGSHRKTSFSHMMTPDMQLQKKDPTTLHRKVRIRSSLSEMSKNFVQTKIQLQNFLERTKSQFGKQLRKKGKGFKLKL